MAGLARSIAIFALLINPQNLHAMENPQDCSRLGDRDDRLACFDRIFPPINRDNPQSPGSGETTGTAPLEARVRQESATLHNWFSITPHRPNYFLPASHNFSSDYSTYGNLGNTFNDTEVKFQVSLKTQLWPNLWRGSSLWGAYTQHTFWQLYADNEASAPFRETNHEPELFWSVPVGFRVLGMQARIASFAFNHQSNGRARPLSRSWNRLTGELILERGRLVVSAKSWIRIDDPAVDDNPDIEDFMGRIQLGAAYKGDHHTLAVGLKNNLSSNNRSGVELNWTFPLTQHLKGFVQAYSGYGENLIDMEDYTNRIGLGIALTDWL